MTRFANQENPTGGIVRDGINDADIPIRGCLSSSLSIGPIG
jgi:hypothetical protein